VAAVNRPGELVRTDQVAIDETVAAYPAFKNADRSTLCFGPSTAAPVEPTFLEDAIFIDAIVVKIRDRWSGRPLAWPAFPCAPTLTAASPLPGSGQRA
jgi:hypothetical protein